MNVLLAEKLFWNFLPRKTPKSVVIWFLKNHDKEKNWIKNSFWMKTFEKNQIWRQVFKNVSNFESRFSKYVRFLVNFKQFVIFGIGIFTAFQILIPLFYHTSVLIWNFKKPFFTTPQAVKKNQKLRVKVWIAFHIASELESRCLQRINFRWKKCC